MKLSQQAIERLKQAATLESAASSIRLAGGKITDAEVANLYKCMKELEPDKATSYRLVK